MLTTKDKIKAVTLGATAGIVLGFGVNAVEAALEMELMMTTANEVLSSLPPAPHFVKKNYLVCGLVTEEKK